LALPLFLLAGLVTPLLTTDVPLLLDDLVAAPLLHNDQGALVSSQCVEVAFGLKPEVRFNDHWRPMGWLSLILDEVLLGSAATGHRLIAGLLHGLLAWLLFASVQRLAGSGARRSATLAGCALLLAPYSVEPVVWVAHRFTLLNALFLLAAMGAAVSWLRRGARGYPLAMSLYTFVAALSKDSALTEAFAVLPALWWLDESNKRSRHLTRLALAISLPIGLILLLRWSCTGVWLPRYADGPEAFALGSVIAQLPRTLGMFFAPFASNGAPARMLVLCSVVLWATFAVIVVRQRRGLSRAGLAMAIWCGALLLAGLPALCVDEWLDGARKFFLPGIALLLMLAALVPKQAWLLLAGTCVLFFFGWMERLDAYHSTAETIAEVCRPIATLESSQRVLLASFTPLPSTHRGVPLFGSDGSHFPLYFHATYGTPRDVRICQPIEVSRELCARTSAQTVVLLRQNPHARPLLHAELLAVPSKAAVATGLEILQPRPESLFPVPGPPMDRRIGFQVRSTALPPWILVELSVPEGSGAFLVALPSVRGLASTHEGENLKVSVPAEALEGVFPVEGQERIAGLLASPGAVDAQLRVSVLAPPGPASAQCSPWTSFRLGAGP
jgi:hypothetical protein